MVHAEIKNTLSIEKRLMLQLEGDDPPWPIWMKLAQRVQSSLDIFQLLMEKRRRRSGKCFPPSIKPSSSCFKETEGRQILIYLCIFISSLSWRGSK